VILGAYFINKHLLIYDLKFKHVKWRNEKQWSISSIGMTREIVVPEDASKLVKVKMECRMENSYQVVAEITCK
jgi:hypothetical protein